MPDLTGALRVALVTETYPPEINGVAMTLGRLAAHAAGEGHQVQLVRPRQGGVHRHAGQVLVPGLPLPGYSCLQFGLPRRPGLRACWRAAPPDIVHVATEGPLGWSALDAAGDLDLPVATTFHTNFHQYSRHYRLGLLGDGVLAWLRHLHNRAGCTLVPTRVQADGLRAQGFARTAVLARGVDHSLFRPGRRSRELRAAWGVGDDGLAVVHVGRVAAEKNLELVHRAFTAIRAQRPDARLVIVGSGPLLESFRSRPEVICPGTCQEADLAAHYASGDLFLFASLTETYGNVVAEALASGLPVVAFAYAAAARLLRDGVNGVPVPCGDEAAFVAAASRLALDDALRRACAERAAASVADLSWPAIGRRWISHLRHCIARHRQRRSSCA